MSLNFGRVKLSTGFVALLFTAHSGQSFFLMAGPLDWGSQSCLGEAPGHMTFPGFSWTKTRCVPGSVCFPSVLTPKCKSINHCGHLRGSQPWRSFLGSRVATLAPTTPLYAKVCADLHLRRELALAPKTQACSRPAAGTLPLAPPTPVSAPRPGDPGKPPAPVVTWCACAFSRGAGRVAGTTACGRPTETPLDFESGAGRHPGRRSPAPDVLPSPTWRRCSWRFTVPVL